MAGATAHRGVSSSSRNIAPVGNCGTSPASLTNGGSGGGSNAGTGSGAGATYTSGGLGTKSDQQVVTV